MVAAVALAVPAALIVTLRPGMAGTGVAVPGIGVPGGGSSGTTTGTTTTTTTSSSATPATNLPADKVTVAGSDVQVFGPNADTVIMQVQMRTSNPADLLLDVTSECSIVTSVMTQGNDSQSAEGQIRMWLTIDGQPVGVVPNTQGQSDDGHVVFCNRVYSSTTSGFAADPNATIKTYISTKQADGFNWVAMNVGNGVHTIQLHAELTQNQTDATKDQAQAVVGDRTLVVNTTETAQNQAG